MQYKRDEFIYVLGTNPYASAEFKGRVKLLPVWAFVVCSRVKFTLFMDLISTAVGRYGWINLCSRTNKSKRIRLDLIVVYTDIRVEAKALSI